MRSKLLIFLIVASFYVVAESFQEDRFLEIINRDLSPQDQDLIAKSLIPFYLERYLKEGKHVLPNAIGDRCRDHLDQWTLQLINVFINISAVDTWALHMVDSWGKIPEGILSGHMASLGDFDECVEIDAQVPSTSNPMAMDSFTGQYCTFILIPAFLLDGSENTTSARKAVSPEELLEMMKDFNPVPQLAMCVPSSCNATEVEEFAITLFSVTSLIKIFIPVPAYPFVSGEERELAIGAKVMIGVYSVLFGICLIGTGLDLWLRNIEQNKSKTSASEENTTPKYGILLQMALAFSLYTNCQRWLNTKSGGDNLGCVHGIRFLSMCWVVVGHTWSMAQMAASIWNMTDLRLLHTHNWTMNTIYNATVSVDTFFTMSGLLVAYNLLKMLEKRKGRFNVPMFYIHRYLRLTPMYALIIGFMATLLPYMTDGPRRFIIDNSAEFCRRNWWHNLLYINNLIVYEIGDGMCESETWYISNDMQFYIVSPLFIYALWRWEKIGMGLLSLATLASVITPSVIIAQNELVPTMIFVEDPTEYLNKIYMKPWARIGPYLVGIWVGFLLYKLKNRPNFRLSLPISLIGWTLSTGNALAILYAPFNWNDPEVSRTKVEDWLYGGFHRTLWGVSVAWVIFACMKGRGGLVNKFLSWKAFIPLGRLTFAIYLVSYNTQIALSIYKGKQPSIHSNFNAMNNFFSEMVLSTFIAFVCTITMESPFMQLEKIIFGRFS